MGYATARSHRSQDVELGPELTVLSVANLAPTLVRRVVGCSTAEAVSLCASSVAGAIQQVRGTQDVLRSCSPRPARCRRPTLGSEQPTTGLGCRRRPLPQRSTRLPVPPPPRASQTRAGLGARGITPPLLAMPPNIFHANAIPGPEDRFTAHWHYLLDTHPELGQRVLDSLASACGLPRTRYAGAEDHPWFTLEDRPDFRLVGADYDLLCEHKLDAALGPAQLERYGALAAAAPKPTYVILIGKSPVPVPQSARTMASYRAPAYAPTATLRAHFLWEDVYPLVEATPGRLAAEFRAYMAALGLEPWAWGTIGDPTQPGEALAQFRRLWSEILPCYRRPGVVVKVDPVGPGFQYQRPMPGIHLVWCGPQRVLAAPADPRVPGRALTLRVWQMASGPEAAAALLGPAESPTIPMAGLATYVRRPMQDGRPDGVLTREYYTPLGGILTGTWHESQQRLAAWVAGAVEHLTVDVNHLVS